jgi:hypothetical protein
MGKIFTTLFRPGKFEEIFAAAIPAERVASCMSEVNQQWNLNIEQNPKSPDRFYNLFNASLNFNFKIDELKERISNQSDL